MHAAWWWIDRWRKSTAYTDMTLEEQGAYRNLLDELWLRDGVLPSEERILAKICGDALAWPRVRGAVLRRFEVTQEGLRNTTHDTVAAQSKRRAEKQKLYRGRRRDSNDEGNTGGNKQGNTASNSVGNPAGSPSPSPSPSPYSGSSTHCDNGNGIERSDALRIEMLVTDIATVTGEKTQNHRTLVRSIPRAIVERAMAETRTAKLEGEIKKTPGAMFNDLCKRYCAEQGVEWPLKLPRTAKGHVAA